VSPRRTTDASPVGTVVVTGWVQRKDINMTENTTSWHHNPIDRRVMSSRPPFFVMSAASRRRDLDALARQRLAALAGL